MTFCSVARAHLAGGKWQPNLRQARQSLKDRRHANGILGRLHADNRGNGDSWRTDGRLCEASLFDIQ